MRGFGIWMLVVGMVSLLAGPAAAECTRVEVCHAPPGAPGVFHTISVCDHVLPKHLAHGDFAGNCAAVEEEICDDGDACTADELDHSTGTERCMEIRRALDCDDDNECTADSCDPAAGCVNVSTGAECDDELFCTQFDTCNPDGDCVGQPVTGCCVGPADCDPSPCARESCMENLCVADPVVCTPPDLCTVSVCSEVSGTCQHTPRVCPLGHACDPADGSCQPAGCPCDYFSIEQSPAIWGDSVNLACPTADNPTATLTGLLGEGPVGQLSGVDLLPEPACYLANLGPLEIVIDLTDAQVPACAAQVVAYAEGLAEAGITFFNVEDPADCLPLQVP